MPATGLNEDALEVLSAVARCNSTIPALIGDLAIYAEFRDSFFGTTTLNDFLWYEIKAVYELSEEQKPIVQKLIEGGGELKPIFEALFNKLEQKEVFQRINSRGPCWPCR